MKLLRPITARYRYPWILLRQMVITDFKLRYQGSVLGYLWSLLKPLALFSILYVVFVRFLKIGGSLPHQPVYLLMGIVVWTFFAEVTNQGLNAVVSRGDVMRKINFPRYVVVLATAFSALINLILNSVVIALFLVLSHAQITGAAAYLPLLLLELFIFSLGLAFFLSALYVKFRDFSHIWELVLQAAFYATPILYPLGLIPRPVARILILNPMAQIIQDLRAGFVTDQTATASTLFRWPYIRLLPVLLTLLIAASAALYFRRRSRFFAEEI